MYGWHNFVDKAKRYFPLEASEKKGLAITILILGFIFSFRNWGVEKFDVNFGISSLITSIILVIVALFIRETAIRTIALWLGYRAQYKAWLLGLVIGLVLAFISNGTFLFIAPGIALITNLEFHKLGKYPYALSYKHLGWIAMSGPIANIIFAAILKSISIATGSTILDVAVNINIWMALFDMIPIPPFNGSMTFFGSRYIYMFVLGALVSCAALLHFVAGILPVIISMLIGALVLWVFFAYVDNKW